MEKDHSWTFWEIFPRSSKATPVLQTKDYPPQLLSRPFNIDIVLPLCHSLQLSLPPPFLSFFLYSPFVMLILARFLTVYLKCENVLKASTRIYTVTLVCNAKRRLNMYNVCNFIRRDIYAFYVAIIGLVCGVRVDFVIKTKWYIFRESLDKLCKLYILIKKLITLNGNWIVVFC